MRKVRSEQKHKQDVAMASNKVPGEEGGTGRDEKRTTWRKKKEIIKRIWRDRARNKEQNKNIAKNTNRGM